MVIENFPGLGLASVYALWSNPYMATTLYHVTPGINVKSIRRRGLLARLSRGRMKAVWLCTESRIEWAIAHVVKSHRCPLSTVRVLAVSPPVSVCGSRVPGLYYTRSDVPAAQIAEGVGRAKIEWRIAQ